MAEENPAAQRQTAVTAYLLEKEAVVLATSQRQTVVTASHQ